jgi:integrase
LLWSELWPCYAEMELETLEAPKTQACMGRHLVRLLGAAPVIETDVAAVRRYRVARKGEITNRRRAPSAKTINNEVILIRRLTKWAARRGLTASNPLANAVEADLLAPVQNVRSNVVDDAPGAHLSLAQFIAEGDAFDRALVLVAHSSGMRRRELALLQLGWIDRTQRLVHIPAGIAKGRRGAKKARTTLISRDALAALDVYRDKLPGAARMVPAAFVNRRRLRGLHVDYFTRRFKKLERRVGIDGPSGPTWLHDLRRSFITLARWGGEDAVNVMKLAGHTTLESQERYHVESMRETVAIRDRIEAARALRRPPKRAPANKSAIQERINLTGRIDSVTG